jgi:long-subunit fatty acid transport protein
MAPAVAVFAAAGVSPAFAQATAQIPLQFDFLPPGARSVGMGSAFIAAADDATAAFTNPAGLARLSSREFSAELRFKQLKSPFLAAGRISGNITGTGLDTIPTPVYGEDVDNHFGPAFLSLLWPVGPKASVTGYLHEVATIENTFFSQGVFERATFLGATDDRTREAAVGGTRKVRIRNYGGAVAYKVSERFSVGGGVSVYQFRLDADFANFGIDGDFAGPPNRNRLTATATQRGSEWMPSFNAGALFDLTKAVKIGGSFRVGPGFDFTQTDRVPSTGLDLTRTGTFKVPDVYGLGLEWRITEPLRVLVDYDRIQYAQLKVDFVNIQALASKRSQQLVLESGNELHAGVEYLIPTPKAPIPIALRAGYWYDPDHAVRYEATPANDEVDVLFSATLPGGSATSHYTFGATFVPTGWFEINAAADLSSRTKYVTFSVVIRK